MQLSNLKRTILVPLAIALAGLAVTFVVILALTRERVYEHDTAQALNTARHIFDTRVQFTSRALEGALAAILSDETLKSRFLDRDRAKLLSASQPLYSQLARDYMVSHLYFIGADERTFLRVHDPDRHGDVLSRTTLRLSRDRKDTVGGIELGPLGTLTLRVIAPWMEGARHLGYVELGVEVSGMVADIEKALNAQTAIFIYKGLVYRPLWEQGMKLLNRVPDWDLLDTLLLTSGNQETLPSGLLNMMNDHTHGDAVSPGGTRIESGNRFLLVALLPIVDAAGWEMADLAILIDVTTIRQVFIHDIAMLGGITVLAGTLLFTGFYVLLDRVQARLQNTERDLVEAVEATKTASRTKSAFLATVSHELRTPLNAIIGFSEMIKSEIMGPLGNDSYKGYVNDIHQAGQDLMKLISDILDISKMEVGEIHLEQLPVDIGLVVQLAIGMVQERAKVAQVALLSEISVGLPQIRGDELRLKQVLLNLVTNALQFTPEGGSITVTARAETDHIVITVTDSGVGMKPEDIPRVLAPFVQLADQMTRNHGGAGLGLPLTKHLVELHKGTLEFTSTPGQGTIATVRLPADRRPLRPRQSRRTQPRPAPPLSSK